MPDTDFCMRLFCCLIVGSLFCCSNASAQTRPQGLQSRQDLNLGYAKVSQHHYTSTWVSDNFDINSGGAKIIWQEGGNPKQFSRFQFGYYQKNLGVGFDVGVGKNTSTRKVADLSTEGHNGWTSPALDRTLGLKFTNNLKPRDAGLPTAQKSYWWMGPKTIIFSRTSWDEKPVPHADKLAGEYECYIVVNSNLTRDELKQRSNLIYVGNNQYGTGASRDVYHHYVTSLPFTGTDGQPKQINQVWTIKDTYSNEVDVPVNRIQRDWMTQNHPNTGTAMVPWNFFNLGWKINLETSGQFSSGSAGWDGLRLPSNDF